MKEESIMSQYLVVLYNNTNNPINFVNTEDESGNNVKLNTGAMFRTADPFNIPDNSNPSQYFSQHHMEVQDISGNALFSFWDNDNQNYNLMYCEQTTWKNALPMPGFDNGGNGATVGIVVSGSPGAYSIQACQVI